MSRRAAVVLLAVALVGCKRNKPERFSRIWLGPKEACGRAASGDLVCWGGPNAEGARPIPSLRDVKELALGRSMSCAVRGAQIECTGHPARSLEASKVVVGGRHACAVETGKGVRCWGDDEHGQAAGLETKAVVRAVTAGDAHTCVAIEADAVHCFGRGSEGAARLLPGASVIALAAGRAHTCALLEGGTARCWGDNDKGQLGDGTENHSREPVSVLGLEGAVEIAAGDSHTCARLRTGTIACWGNNAFFQIADGTNERRPRATPVRALFGVAEIAASADGTCARLGDGDVRCWGRNDSGQLAPNQEPGIALNVPTPVRYVRNPGK